MANADILQQCNGPFQSKMGAVFVGERGVFRGLDVATGFPNTTWMDMYVFGISGRRLPANELRVLEGLWTCTNYPDARLWNNKVAALAGTTRSHGGAALSAALAASDAKLFGRQAQYFVCDFLVRTLARVTAGEELLEIVRQERAREKIIGGFGRAISPEKSDERLPSALALLEREQVPIGPHFTLAFQIEDALKTLLGRPLPMTYAAVSDAIMLDLGFSPRECNLLNFLMLVAAMPPCYLEGLAKPEGASFVLRCEQLQYDGPARRKWSD
jgi:citrate synthase